MQAYSSYVSTLRRLVRSSASPRLGCPDHVAIRAALDGQASDELRRLVSREQRRTAGAFFTGSRLAKLALRPILGSLNEESIVLDPACGAGDLLIGCAAHLPVRRTLAATVLQWGKHLVGRDLHREFITAAKARLILTAAERGVKLGRFDPKGLDKMFPKIKRRCGLTDYHAISAATHIVINPPFSTVEAPEECEWTTGRVNVAALFLEACFRHAPVGARLVAILPDVLRSGSHYAKWRTLLERNARVRGVKSYGQFDQWTDVDVFVLNADIRRSKRAPPAASWQMPAPQTGTRVDDHFNISVGPVVDSRDAHLGPWYPFLVSRGLPTWETVHDILLRRRHTGRVFFPPVVVVRRTSRPGDAHRATATLISGKRPVAVENHLLVLCPKDSTVRRCRELLCVLKDERTNSWLDRRICCRHLTVSALSDLPYWSDIQ